MRELHNAAISAHYSLRLRDIVEGYFRADFDVSRVSDHRFGDEGVLWDVPGAGAEFNAVGINCGPKLFCAQFVIDLETEAGLSSTHARHDVGAGVAHIGALTMAAA